MLPIVPNLQIICIGQLWIEYPVFVVHCWTVYHVTVHFSFGMVLFTLPLFPDCLYSILAVFGISLLGNPS